MPFRPLLPGFIATVVMMTGGPAWKSGRGGAVLPRQGRHLPCRVIGGRRLRHLWHGWSRAISAGTSPGGRLLQCRTCRAPAATRRPATSSTKRPRTAPRSARSSRARCCSHSWAGRPWAVPLGRAPGQFIYLGSSSSDVFHCFARTDAPATTIRGALQRELVLGTGNENATTRELPAMMNNLAGTKFRLTAGFASSQEIVFAVERNQVHGACGIGWAGFTALYPYWFDKKLITVTLQLSLKGHPELNAMGVPLAAEFARTKDDRQAMELVLSQGLFGRPYVLPPGVPPERVAALRTAFMAAMTDPALIADAKRTNLDLDAMSGGDIQSLMDSLYALPPGIIERAKQSLIYKPDALTPAREDRHVAVADMDMRGRRCDGHKRRQGAGCRRAILSGQDDHHLYRLVGRWWLRRLCARAQPPYGQIHSRQSGDRAAEHAGRRRQQGRRLCVFGGAQGRHRDRRAVSGRHSGAALGDTPIQHDPSKFIFVGSANSDVYTCVVRTDSPIKSFKDAFTQEVIVGASNEGGTTRDMPTLSNNVLGTKFRVVTGYAGTREITLAVERQRNRTACAASATPACCRCARNGSTNNFVRILVQENTKGAAGAEQAGRAAHRGLRQDAGRPAGDGAGLQPGGDRPPLCAAGRRAARARGGAAQGVHGRARRPGAARGSREDEARRRADLRRRCARPWWRNCSRCRRGSSSAPSSR